jgi:SAM-dependent methyltransferase
VDEPAYLQTTRRAYDTVAADYAALLDDELAEKPVQRAMLDLLAELVLADGGGSVGDLGCGPGRVTAYLGGRGLDAFGVDLSPGMVEVARATYPDLRFEVGALAALDLPDGSLAGAAVWYSLIHVPPADRPAVLAELHRVLAPGGHLLLAFQAGEDERVHREQAYGHAVELDSYRLSAKRVTEELARTGLGVHARMVRQPADAYETTPQAYLLARNTA